MFAVRPVIWHFLWWALLAPLLLLELRALHELEQQLALRDGMRVEHVLATVTGYRNNGPNAMIRYHFQRAGDSMVYSPTDLIGRRDLWMPVDSAVGLQARREKTIDVTYLVENPWANQPRGRIGNPVADGFAGWVLFLLVDLAWVGETFLIVRNFLRCLLAAERQQPVRMRFWRSIRV